MSSSLIAFAAGLFFTDYACGYLLYTLSDTAKNPDIKLLALALCFAIPAFALRIVAGIYIDLTDNKRIIGASCRIAGIAGLVFTAAALITGIFSAYPAAILAGTGVALTGCAATVNGLSSTPGYTRAGIILAFAPAGFFTGMHIAETGLFPMQYAFVMLAFSVLCLGYFCGGSKGTGCLEYTDDSSTGSKHFILRDEPLLEGGALTAIVILVAALTLSFTAFSAYTPGSDSRFAWLMPSAAVLAGLFAGGIAADCFGGRFTTTAALLLAAPVFYLGTKKHIFYVAGLLLVSSVLPVLICELSRRIKKKEGISAGLFTLALFAGGVFSKLAFGGIIPEQTDADALTEAAEAASGISAELPSDAAGTAAETLAEAPGYAKLLIPLLCVLSAVILFIIAGNKRIRDNRSVK